MHSRGEVPENSVLAGLTRGEKMALGKKGGDGRGVWHLVFMTAFVTRVGQCLMGRCLG